MKSVQKLRRSAVVCSCLACVATLLAWGATARSVAEPAVRTPSHGLAVQVSMGRLALLGYRQSSLYPVLDTVPLLSVGRYDRPIYPDILVIPRGLPALSPLQRTRFCVGGLGFTSYAFRDRTQFAMLKLLAPLWLVALGTAAGPAVYLFRRRHRLSRYRDALPTLHLATPLPVPPRDAVPV